MEQPKRPNFFAGQILTAEDLQAEQDYFLARSRRHNRFLHGWGVVHGLDVATHRDTLVVQPGLAIDCAGNEIVLTVRIELDVPRDADDFFVTVAYEETGVDPVPALYADSDAGPAWTRIQEGGCVAISTADPSLDHEGIGPGTPGCGRRHPLTIAHVVKVAARWRTDLRATRHGENGEQAGAIADLHGE
jgi:hypothetical protein